MMLANALARPTAPNARPGTLARDRWRPTELVLWLAPLLVLVVFPDRLVLGTQILITALFALSLDLLLGYAGIVSLGHAAFFGVGAYAAGLSATHGVRDPLLGLLAAGTSAALVGLSVSLLVVRGSDLARLMVTLGIGLTFQELANRAASITGGVDGLDGITMGKLLGVFAFGLDGRTAYVYSFVVLLALFALLRRIVSSPYGLALRGLRERATRMPALGVSVTRLQVTAFTLAAGVAGIAGALLAQTTQFVGIDVLGFPRSAELLIMVVLGGAGRLYGGLVGAALYMLVQDAFSRVSHVYWQFWVGVGLVTLVLFARGGILGLIRERIRGPA